MYKPKIIFLGKTPPPFIGPAVASQLILRSSINNHYRLIHLNTSDHRNIKTLGRFDIVNLLIAFKLYFQLLYLIIRYWPSAVYIPSQQTRIGYLRDLGFIYISKLFGRKVICHLRGAYFLNWYNEENKLIKWIVRITQQFVNAQIVLGSNLRNLYSFCMPQNKIHVVHNGGNFGITPSQNKPLLPIRFLFLGNMIESKGVFDFLSAIPFVMSKSSNAEFVFAGDWTNEKDKVNFEKFLIQNPTYPISYLGVVSGAKKIEALCSAHVFVFPTYFRNEGHPWVILEAMAAGLPVITTDHGSISETVFDNDNGFIVEKRNKNEIAEKILFFLNNPYAIEKMGIRSRKLYETHFTEEVMIDNLKKVFDSVTCK